MTDANTQNVIDLMNDRQALLEALGSFCDLDTADLGNSDNNQSRGNFLQTNQEFIRFCKIARKVIAKVESYN